MTQIKQFIGAILSEVTKAQAISDTYSRDLKHSYQEDPVLNLLSVPRTKIKEVTIDLKFAILKTETENLESKVVIYQDANYQGASQQLSEGEYNLPNLTIGNDQLSSLKVPNGIKVTLYEHSEFKGRFKSFTEDTPWVGDDFNDITSSIKVEKILMTDIESMEIEVVTDNLPKFPESAISSISITLDMTML
ncbi:MAG: hypothetical protein ACRC8Y_03490 [Chroococcales cyanobacterium]